ncbi:hypothetical protein NSE01_30240 [Novosphingobium sediminis]|uniref:Uncharacterized protein n=1 Tax=Novosphingobium sediminis TaxID=707214 RepID=A0A512ANA1_9SPHN|nr:hypothetical protein NSE01_30240 [Novosphingobium sediminis]
MIEASGVTVARQVSDLANDPNVSAAQMVRAVKTAMSEITACVPAV